ncbi:MAG TPA: hypothetical protein IAA41_08910 [Candidatus Eubacterium faecavium]|nr:hypothetical protein [Candidatus Eubacterium faecavium]
MQDLLFDLDFVTTSGIMNRALMAKGNPPYLNRCQKEIERNFGNSDAFVGNID